MNYKLLCLILLSATLLYPVNLSADLILSYVSSASTVDPTATANTTGDGLISASLQQSGGLTARTGASFNWRNWDTANTSFAEAVAANDSWTFGFTVGATGTGGNVTSVDLTTLSMRVKRSGTGPDDIELRAYVNGGSETSIFTHDYGDSDSVRSFSNLDISSIGPLSVGDTLEFVFAGFNSESTVGTMNLANFSSSGNGIEVNGMVNFSSVPEPTSLLMFGATALIGLKRRRKTSRA
ncbi:PEP-CTERM sorting domain-containing protein [Mariniblastus sp.]|nr:PEP-CTERM sorting domain-containing protein [Mariniblastus sp.]